MAAASDLTAFVDSLSLDPDQTLTVVAHSFGSIVTGAALADCGLQCTDVVVAGSPGMTVDDLRELHLEQSHFFSEQAPGDAIAELGVFGTAPASPTFGGTRMSTNAPDHRPGARALQLLRAGLRGAGEHGRRGHRPLLGLVRHRPPLPEIAGGLVAWLPADARGAAQVGRAALPGPGFRVLVNWCRLVDLGASETGNLVSEVLDESERALLWVAHRVGCAPRRALRAGLRPGRRLPTRPRVAARRR